VACRRARKSLGGSPIRAFLKTTTRKDRITVTLCCNTTGSSKVPVPITGKAIHPHCLSGQGNEFPLSYLSQKSAWTDATVFQRWFLAALVPVSCARTTPHLYLIIKNM